MKQKELERRQIKAMNHHINNIKRLGKGNPTKKELKKMYSYLDSCWVCGKPITFLDRLTFNVQHSFEGNCHKRNCVEIEDEKN